MKLTLAITNYNRYELLLKAYAEVIDDPRISEVLIMDDHSDPDIFKLVHELRTTHPKIRVIRQTVNRGMMQNKADAIAFSKNEWVIIFDSDNIIRKDYLDAIPETLDSGTIYLPDFAAPNFNYQMFGGWEVTSLNVKRFVLDDNGNLCLNTCNYLVHRDTYGKVFKNNPEMKGTDTIYMAYLWLTAGKKFYVVPGMSYYHRVHPGSGFMADAAYNMKKSEEVRKLIAAL